MGEGLVGLHCLKNVRLHACNELVSSDHVLLSGCCRQEDWAHVYNLERPFFY